MQISSGWARGMRLAVPDGEATRPTSAKVRAATLNMLAPHMEDGLFLDLFAGSGAMGLEALSRGARGAVFVEKASKALVCLRQNMAELKRRAAAQDLEAGIVEVLATDAVAALGRLKGRGPFDLVFVDPPYRQAAELAGALLAGLEGLTSASAVVAFETAASDSEELLSAAARSEVWHLLKQRAYGDTMITLLTKAANEPEDGDDDGGEEG